MNTVGTVPFAVLITRLAADVTEAMFQVESDRPSPGELADRLLEAAMQLIPVSQLRDKLDAYDADAADRLVDIAEEAKLAVKRMGG